MGLSSDILLLALAEECLKELGLSTEGMTGNDFQRVVAAVYNKITLLPRECRDFSVAETAQDDDEQRSFFLGKPSLTCTLVYPPQTKPTRL
jgi:hypothetical protein